MSKYEVQEHCWGGWENTWSEEDDQGNSIPSVYSTPQEAQIALDDFFYQCEEAVEDGNMEDVPARADFRIVEVKDENIHA